MKRIFFCIFILLHLSLFSQVDTSALLNLLNLPMDSLMDISVAVATKKSVELMKSPAVITVITHSEIENSGARDLKELLEIFVPAIQFGVDVEGVIGIGFRGMWAYEGKVLLLIDGLEMNEEMFGTIELGNHYSLDNILRIEISRGPGSVLYGGYAGLTVINIITKRAGMDSFEFSSTLSPYANKNSDLSIPANSSLNAMFGYTHNKLKYSSSVAYQLGSRSDFDNIDYYRNKIGMKSNSAIRSLIFNSGFKYNNFSFRQIIDLYHYNQVDLWGQNHSAMEEKFDTYITNLFYKIKINKRHYIVPGFVYKYQRPWQLKVPDKMYANTKYISQLKFTLVDDWNISSRISLLSGIDVYQTSLYLPQRHEAYEENFINGRDRMKLNTAAFFAQALIFSDFANIAIGWRSDYSSTYGYTGVPRLAFTKHIKHINLKLLFNQSYRIPGGIIPNRILPDVRIRPERGGISEFQFSYTRKKLCFSLNFFNIKFKKIIVYASNPKTGVGSYRNFGSTDNIGGEAEMRFYGRGFSIMLNYAYYYSLKNDVHIYSVAGKTGYMLAFSPHRLNMIADLRISKFFTLNFVNMFYGTRYGYVYLEAGKNILKKFGPTLISNIHLNYNSIEARKIHFQLGISNIFDSKLSYIQPYMGQHSPLPSWGRTVDFKIVWIIN